MENDTNQQNLDDRHLTELDDLISKGDKKYIQYWLSQNKVSARVYAKAESFLNLKEWKKAGVENEAFSIGVFEGRAYSEGDILVSRMVAKQIDILLNPDLTTEQQKEKIKELQEPYKDDLEIINGLNKHSYWHSLHIIMNCFSMSEHLTKKARSERLKNMKDFNKKILSEFPMFDVKNYIIESNIKLTSQDRGKWQSFEYINDERDFDITENKTF